MKIPAQRPNLGYGVRAVRMQLLPRLVVFLLIICMIIPHSPAKAAVNAPSYLERLNEITRSAFEGVHYMTREEFCVAAGKTLFDAPPSYAELPFADSELLADESKAYIAEFYSRGILVGVAADGRPYLNPHAEISLQDALTLLGRVLSVRSDAALAFSDAEDIAEYSREYVSWFAEWSIIAESGALQPTEPVCAEELAMIVLRTRDIKERSGTRLISISGTGTGGLRDGSNESANYLLPYGVLLAADGGLIVFDTYNNAIREINGGTVSTIAGAADESNLDENRLPKGGRTDGRLTNARLNRPVSGAFNAKGELLVCDSANDAIRLVSNDRMQTLRDADMLSNPMAIAIDRDESIYVADTLNNCIRRISGDDITVVAGIPGEEGYADGEAAEALFRAPSGIAVKDGVIYVADTGNHRIRKIEDGIVTSLAGSPNGFEEDKTPIGGFGNGQSDRALFSLPMGLALADDGLLFVADSGNNMIRAVTVSGAVLTVAGTGDPGDKDGVAAEAMLHHPMGLCFSKGTLYIADTGNNKIKKIELNTGAYGW